MNNKIKAFIGVLLVLFSISDASKIENYIRSIIPRMPNTPVLVIDRPSDHLLEMTKKVSVLITDKADREKAAVLFLEAGNRKYKTVTPQQLNDILTMASREYWGTTIKGKYPGLSEGLQKIVLVQNTEAADAYLSPDELMEYSLRFKALAWNLIN